MCERTVFRGFLSVIEPIRMHDPLATLLGAFEGSDEVLEYHFTDVIKMAGHGCPTVSMAFVACKHAVRALFPDGIGVRGSISVLVHGERDDGVYGVIAQVFSLITGACPESGFKGLGGLHRRNNLLRFGVKESDTYLRFDFTRTDTKRTCLVTLIPAALPSLTPAEQERVGALREYQKYIKLSDYEVRSFSLYCDVAHAMHVLRATFERQVNKNFSKENTYWLKLGRIGLGLA